MKYLVIAALATCAFSAGAAETLEYRMNGVEVKATYTRGTEARALIARYMAASPASAGARPQQSVQGPWRITSARAGSLSRVLQVRGEGAQLEAIASELDASRPPRSAAVLPVWLPPSSVLLSSIEVLRPSASKQWVARSPWTVPALRGWLGVSARLAGWRVAQPGAPFDLMLQRGDQRLAVAILPMNNPNQRGSFAVFTGWAGP